MNPASTLSVAAGTLLAVAIVVTASPSCSVPDGDGRQTPEEFAPPAPPSAVWAPQTVLRPSVGRPDTGVRGEVSVQPRDRTVTIDWAFDDESGQRVFGEQAFRVDYWPTAAASVEERLIVAGLRPTDGNTIIEAWTLAYPSPPTNATFEASITGSRVLYDANAAGLSEVRLMKRLERAGAPSEAVLIQFTDSEDLYSFDLQSSTLSQVFTSAQVPALSEPYWAYVWAGDHPTKGFVYVYQYALGGDVHDSLVLFDAGRDGDVDSWQVLDSAGWAAQLGSPATWTSLFE